MGLLYRLVAWLVVALFGRRGYRRVDGVTAVARPAARPPVLLNEYEAAWLRFLESQAPPHRR